MIRSTLILVSALFVTGIASNPHCGLISTFVDEDFISVNHGFAEVGNPPFASDCITCRTSCINDPDCLAYKHTTDCVLYTNITSITSGVYQTQAILTGILPDHITAEGFKITLAKLKSPYAFFPYANDDEPRCRKICLEDPNCAGYQQPTCALSTMKGSGQWEEDAIESVHIVGNIPDNTVAELVNIDSIKTDMPNLSWGAEHTVSKIYAGTDDVIYYIDALTSNTVFYPLESLNINTITAAEINALIVGAVGSDFKYVIDSNSPPAAVVRKSIGSGQFSIFELSIREFSMDISQCSDNTFKFNLFDGLVKPEHGRVTVLSSNPDDAVCTTTVLNGDSVEFDMAVCNIEFMVSKLYVYHADSDYTGMSTIYNVSCSPDYLSVDVAHSMVASLYNVDYNHVVHEAVFNIELMVLDQVTGLPPAEAPKPKQPLKLVANITDSYRLEFDLRITSCSVNDYVFYENEGPLTNMAKVAQDIDVASQYINFELFFPPSNQLATSLTYECSVVTCWGSCDPVAPSRKRRSVNKIVEKKAKTVIFSSLPVRKLNRLFRSIWWTRENGYRNE